MYLRYEWKKNLLLLLIITTVSLNLSAEDEDRTLFDKGKTYYSNGKYLEALYFFNELIDGNSSDFLGDAWFWSSKAYLAAGEIENAEKSLEFFLLSFPRNSNYSEGYYYKGRILFIQKEYEKAIDLFNRFIRSSPFSPFSSNAYYWIGECLYSTGYFDEALEMYKKVANEYPSSYKFEAANYKISLIEYRYREEELLQLIRWSHEESLRTIEEYRNREKSYLQTIEAYQKRIMDLESGSTGADSETLKRLADAAQKLEEYLRTLQEENRAEESEEISEN